MLSRPVRDYLAGLIRTMRLFWGDAFQPVVLVERKMSAGALVVVDVRRQDAEQMALVEDHDVIQTLIRDSSQFLRLSIPKTNPG